MKLYDEACILTSVLKASVDHAMTAKIALYDEDAGKAFNHLEDIRALQNELNYRLNKLLVVCEMDAEDSK